MAHSPLIDCLLHLAHKNRKHLWKSQVPIRFFDYEVHRLQNVITRISLGSKLDINLEK